MLVYARMIVGQVPWSRDVCSTRPSDQGCLYRRLAFVLPSTASLHSHRVPADKLSTQPGTLDQGCLYCRLAFVLPWTVSSHSHWVPADKLSTQPGSLDQGCRCSRPVLVLPPLPATSHSQRGACRPNQVLGTRGVCAADQPWC